MEGMSIAQILLTIGLGIGGWFMRTLWDNHKELEKELNSHKNDVAKNYVPRDDYKETMREIREMFDKIFAKLDNKADKETLR